MSSLSRMLVILDCFTPEEPLLTAEQIVSRLGYNRATAYRYLRELNNFGLLSRLDGGFILGPRVIELDYLIRQYDPVLKASLPVMQELGTRFEADVLLVNFFNDRLLVSHREHGDDKRIRISYGRGRRMPLFSGAAAKVILASLSMDKQRRIFDANLNSISTGHLPTNWADFRKELVTVQKARCAVSFGELDAGHVAVASPLLHGKPYPPGAICIVFSEHRYGIIDKSQIEQAVISAAERIQERVERLSDPKGSPPSKLSVVSND